MKQTEKSVNGTLFHDVTILTSKNKLVKIIGEPTMCQNDGCDKTNYEWEMELNDGRVFTIYDWKEYRSLKDDEIVRWHIGANDRKTSLDAKRNLEK